MMHSLDPNMSIPGWISFKIARRFSLTFLLMVEKSSNQPYGTVVAVNTPTIYNPNILSHPKKWRKIF